MALKAELTYDDAKRRWRVRVVEPADGGTYSTDDPEKLMRHLVEEAVEHGAARPCRDQRPRHLVVAEWVLENIVDTPLHWVERALMRVLPYSEHQPRAVRAVTERADWLAYKCCVYHIPHLMDWLRIEDGTGWLRTEEMWGDPDDEEASDVGQPAELARGGPGELPAGGAAPAGLREEAAQDAARAGRAEG